MAWWWSNDYFHMIIHMMNTILLLILNAYRVFIRSLFCLFSDFSLHEEVRERRLSSCDENEIFFLLSLSMIAFQALLSYCLSLCCNCMMYIVDFIFDILNYNYIYSSWDYNIEYSFCLIQFFSNWLNSTFKPKWWSNFLFFRDFNVHLNMHLS